VSRLHPSYAIAAVAVVAAIGGDALALFGRDDGSGSVGRPAPTLSAEVLVPPKVTIGSLRGRPAAISFWASWCEPCRQEAPAFARLSRRLKGQASLVGLDWEDDRDAALAFIGEYGWDFPILRAAGGGLASRFGVIGVPATVILDRMGRISEVLQGPQTAGEVERALGLAVDSRRITAVGVGR
jgi:cytochrome c biogenesis protein CcmG/thiol:disulfide interchange protein DsbE